MKTTGLITRRRAIVTGLASVGGLIVARYPNDLPPTYGHLLRMGDTFTYAAHRALLPGQSLVREYGHGDITSFPATGTTNPGITEKSALGGRLPPIAERGVRRLAAVGRGTRGHAANVLTRRAETAPVADADHATYVRGGLDRHRPMDGRAARVWCSMRRAFCRPPGSWCSIRYDDWVDSIDLLDALHPQTILAYGMNGRDLPIPHGAPVRLRVERQLGYKSMKYLRRIVVTDEFDDGGEKGNIQNGWAWYTGI